MKGVSVLKKLLKICFVVVGLVVVTGSSIIIRPKGNGIDPGVVHRVK